MMASSDLNTTDTKLDFHDHEDNNVFAGAEDSPSLSLTINYRGEAHHINTPEEWTLLDLATMVAETYKIPADKQRYMVTPRGGTYKLPFPTIQLRAIKDKKIVLIGTPTAEVTDIQSALLAASLHRRRRTHHSAPKVWKRHDWKKESDESTYTFLSIKPLPYLPSPSRSQRFLERLASDPGIKTSMRHHKFSVGLLTEMDPAAHTTHESRTLGLNRNRGEVIELRLRTDAYDGYRDYKTIRKTLCHELAHNVFGEHDRDFWDLCGRIEREVERGDWTRGGRSVGEEEFYGAAGGEGVGEVCDHGGWTGGAFVLGRDGAGAKGGDTAVVGTSRRDVLAKAAEERRKREREGRMGEGGPESDEHGGGEHS